MSAGFVLLDKPRGPTSHDMVDVVRRALGMRRVGHAGTLDPPASGLLVMAVGAATRLLRYVQGLPKVYTVTGALGTTTTTLDADGETVDRRPVDVTPDAIRAAAADLTGDIDQVPPAVSAINVGGERAYRRAAKGEVVELEARRVHVERFDILRTSPLAFDARVECSSGTYVRSLVADLGEALSCGAHVVSLRRDAIGHLTVADACKPDAVTAGDVRRVEDVLTHLRRVELGAEEAERASHGQKLPTDVPEGEVLVVGPEGAVGVFAAGAGILRPVTVLGGS